MIRSMCLSQLAVATNGQLKGKDIDFDSVAIDTRTINKGDLFIALKGDRFDGHQFIDQAISKGCSSLVVTNDSVFEDQIDKKRIKADISCLYVEDSLRALGECARINRENFSGAVVGLTGSTGKTSTKNMLESIFLEKGATCATQGNFNNEVGVPLTLLGINEQHKYAVVEMGARKIGDIEYLANLVQADVAILLNAGNAHIEIFGSQENIVRAKGEIFTELKEGASAVVNFDDLAKEAWLSTLIDKRVLTFSVSNQDADVFASEIMCTESACNFVLNHNGSQEPVSLPVPGRHSIANSLAAAAAAILLDFDMTTIASGLKKLNSASGRLMSIACSERLVVIDDSYNANPASMKAAVDVLSLRAGFKVAVLAEMAELGDFSKKFHLDLAQYVAESNIDRVYLIGRFADEMALIIGDKAIAMNTKSEILESLANQDHVFDLSENYNELVTTSVLVKGSRSTAMDELVSMIIKRAH